MKEVLQAIYNMFIDADKTFSWRKGLTAVTAFTFSACSLGYAFTPWVRVLPGEYTAIISGVFVFYFIKSALPGLKITNDTQSGDK